MPQTVASLLTAFLTTFLMLPLVIRFFSKRNIFDKPGGRKIHKAVTPSMGGIAIFVGLMLAVLLWMPLKGVQQFKYIFGASILMFIVGLRDDLIPVRPLVKLSAQVLASVMVVSLSNVQLRSLYGLLGIHEIPYMVALMISIFTIIVITNSYNLIDGLDGLAGSIGVICFLSYGLYFFLVDDIWYSMLCLGMVGALVAFLNFNWEPSRIFMGDTGALLIGFLLSVVTIHFIDFNTHLPKMSQFKVHSPVGIAVAIVIMPLFDTLRVFISRAMRKQSPFSPDKTHIHHLIMRLGFTHQGTTLILILVNIVFVVTAFILQGIGNNWLVLIIVGMAMVLSLFLDWLLKYQLMRKRRG